MGLLEVNRRNIVRNVDEHFLTHVSFIRPLAFPTRVQWRPRRRILHLYWKQLVYDINVARAKTKDGRWPRLPDP